MRWKTVHFLFAAALAVAATGFAHKPAEAGNGGSFAAGAATGLFLGAILAPRPYVAAPPGPGYGYVAPARNCWQERYQSVDPFNGYPVWRVRTVCQ